jgi:hypothetical protein
VHQHRSACEPSITAGITAEIVTGKSNALSCRESRAHAAVCAVNGGHERLGMGPGRRCLGSSSSGSGPADTGDVQDALDTREAQAVGSGAQGR